MPKLCPNCDYPMDAGTVKTAWGTEELCWKCNNPECKTKHYYRRFETLKAPDKDKCWSKITLHRKDTKQDLAQVWTCPGCGNILEILDACPYYIWNCPNCLLVRSGGFGVRYFELTPEGSPDYSKELKEERIPAGSYWDPFYNPEEEEEEIWEDD